MGHVKSSVDDRGRSVGWQQGSRRQAKVVLNDQRHVWSLAETAGRNDLAAARRVSPPARTLVHLVVLAYWLLVGAGAIAKADRWQATEVFLSVGGIGAAVVAIAGIAKQFEVSAPERRLQVLTGGELMKRLFWAGSFPPGVEALTVPTALGHSQRRPASCFERADTRPTARQWSAQTLRSFE